MSKTNERDAVMLEFWKGDGVHVYDSEAMADEIVRLRTILAALREPSEQVKKAVGRDEFMRLFTGEWETIPVGYDLTAAMIRAAVAAAEQEVRDA